MKKSTLAIATLLTTLSIAIITPAYADDSVQDPNVTNNEGCSSCSGCNKSGDATAPATEDMNAQPAPSSDTSS